MPNDFIKTLIRKKALRKLAVWMIVFFCSFIFVWDISNAFSEALSLSQIKYNEVRSLDDLAELNQLRQRETIYIKLLADSLNPTRIRNHEYTGKIIDNYLWAEFSDGIVIIEYPYSDYEKLNFRGKTLKLKGHITVIDEELTELFKALDERDFAEIFAKQNNNVFVLDSQKGMRLSDGNFRIIISVVFLIMCMIKNILLAYNYKLSKDYRALKHLNHKTLEDAENSIIHDYNQTQTKCIFDNSELYISERYIIIKKHALFGKTSDLTYVKEEIRPTKYRELYHVTFKFRNIKKPVKVRFFEKETMKALVIFLRDEILLPQAFENIVETFIKQSEIRKIKTPARIQAFITLLMLGSINSELMFLFVPAFVLGLVNLLYRLQQIINYKFSKSYYYFKNFDYETPEDAEDAIIYDYNINKDEHIFENQKIFISKNFIIFKRTAEFRETKKLKNIVETIKEDLSLIRFFFDNDYVEFHLNYREVIKLAHIVREDVLHLSEYDAEELYKRRN